MRKYLILAALIAAAPAAHAAPLMAPQALRPAIESVTNVETVGCVRYGWRGAGVYPGCYRGPRYAMAAPYYVAPRVYVAPPVYMPPPRQCWYAGAWRPC
jgi:hypothetical protein